MENTENLNKFGMEFQIKCVTALVSDRSFIEQISDILEIEFFESDAHQWIVDQALKYFMEYKDVPSLNVFKVQLDKVTQDSLRQSIVEKLKLVYQKMKDSDLRFIKEQFLIFCKNQKLKCAIIDSVEYLENGNYEQIKSVIDDAMKAGMERNVGHDYAEEVDLRMSKMSRNSVATNWQTIDTIMDGGLASGELGIVTAASGGGKSWVLAKIGAEAMRQGKNVLHVTLELNENYTGLRYDSCFTGIDFQNIRNNVDVVKETINKIKGKLCIKFFPTKTVSAHGLKAHAERLAVLGNKPDVIILDYADLLKTSNGSSTGNNYNDAGGIYEDLRGVAGELQIPIWSASQSNRSAIDADIIEANSIADSYRKIMTADFILSLSRKSTDKVNNTARFHIIKNRFGPDGITFPSRMNAGCGEIEIYDSNSTEGNALQSEMANGENQLKKIVKDKWDAMQSE